MGVLVFPLIHIHIYIRINVYIYTIESKGMKGEKGKWS